MYCCKTLIKLNEQTNTLCDFVVCDAFIPLGLNDNNPNVTFRFKQIESIFKYSKRKKSSPYEAVLRELNININIPHKAIEFDNDIIVLNDDFKKLIFGMYGELLPNILDNKSKEINIKVDKITAPDLDKLVKAIQSKFTEVDKLTIIKNLRDPYNK